MEYYYYNVRAIRRLKHICPWVRSGGQHMEHCHSCYLLMLALCQTETNRKNAAQHSLLLLCKYNLFDIITNVRYTLYVFVCSNDEWKIMFLLVITVSESYLAVVCWCSNLLVQ